MSDAIKAKDLMTTRVVTVGENETVSAVAELMISNRVSALPVVDEDDKLVGIVSEGDLIHRKEVGTDVKPRSWWLHLWRDADALASEYAKSHGAHARDVMTEDVVTVDEDSSLQQVAETIEKHGIKRVPVLRDGVVVGIVSRANIVQRIAATKTLDIEIYWDDQAIKTQIEHRLEEQPWASVGTTSVTVTDGIVEFWGAKASDNESHATKALAEEIPGVKGIQDHRAIRADLMSKAL